MKQQMIKMISTILLTTLLVCSCNQFDNQTKLGSTYKEAGRFQMLQFERTSANGIKTPTVVRIDSTTGETWMLDLQGESIKWVSISDNLRRVLTYNKEGQKIDSGIKTPDGRDLKDLSTDELIRLLTAAPSPVNATIDAQGMIVTPDGARWRREGDVLVPADRPPDDPLGLRKDTFVKPGGALDKLLKGSQKQNSQKK